MTSWRRQADDNLAAVVARKHDRRAIWVGKSRGDWY
jgi:hypothetical protein